MTISPAVARNKKRDDISEFDASLMIDDAYGNMRESIA